MGVAARVAGKAGALSAFCFVAAFAAVAHAQCADPLRLPVSYGAVDFTQTRHLAGVRAPLVSRGRATIGTEQVEWDVTDPVSVRTTISQSGIVQSVEGGPPQRVGPQGDAFLSSAGLFSLLAGDFASLGNHYDIARRNADGGRWTVRLTPRAEAFARFVSFIEVSGCERVAEVGMQQSNGDRMEIELTPAPR